MMFPQGAPSLILRAMSWAGDTEAEQSGRLLALAAFSAIWITALGASVGSFLNVVVWRLPQGMSLVRPKSRCPKCGSPILARDNLPVIGWLRLRGRCRACNAPISARYPLVEAITALMFLGLAHFELFGGGSNLPGGPPAPAGLTAVLWHLRPEVIGVFAYHATLLSLLLCLGLIVWDGFRPPRSLVGIGVAVGLLAPVLLPAAHPIKSGLHLASWPHWSFASEFVSFTVVPAELAHGLVGLAIGLVIGAIVAIGVPRASRGAADRGGVVAVGALGGAFLGWQAVIGCGFAAALLSAPNIFVSLFVRRRLPTTVLFGASVLVFVLYWRWLLNQPLLPTAIRGWQVLRVEGWSETEMQIVSSAVLAAATGAIALATRAVRKVGVPTESAAVEPPEESESFRRPSP
jgi:leader peptidase (prepilin peptidase)/N-methyltransferase